MKHFSLRVSLTLLLISITTLVLAAGAVLAPITKLCAESEIIVVGKVTRLSPSEIIGKWNAPQAIATVQINEIVFGKEIGKEMMVLTDDNKKVWPHPTDTVLNFVTEGQSYLFFLVKNKNGKGRFFTPAYSGIRDPQSSDLENAKRYIKGTKNKGN
jgi:hypothetical protein